MSFGLKNAGATYQRAVNKIFRKQIGHNMKVYVVDMVVKLVREVDYMDDLQDFHRAE